MSDQQKEPSNLATFLQHLLSAGMSTEEAIKHGFQYAVGESELDENGFYIDKLQAMRGAAQKLEDAAKEVGIHLSQLQARMMERK